MAADEQGPGIGPGAPPFAGIDDIDSLASLPFDEIYRKAGVEDPDHGFTVYKLVEMTSAEEFLEMDPAQTAKVITGMLKRLPGGPVPLEDIFRDAEARDGALEALDTFLEERAERIEQEAAAENDALQAEIDRLVEKNTSRMASNRDRAGSERAGLTAWRLRKEAEQRKLADAVAPFVAGGRASPIAARTPPPFPAAAPAGAAPHNPARPTQSISGPQSTMAGPTTGLSKKRKGIFK